MARTTRYTTQLEDANGSFAQFIREAPKVAREACKAAVEKTTFAVFQRMQATVPVGPDAPHIKDDLAMKVRGLVGRVGILQASGEGDSAHIALYQEYGTTRHGAQPFMRPAAKAEEPLFVRRMQEAIGQIERRLGSGTGI